MEKKFEVKASGFICISIAGQHKFFQLLQDQIDRVSNPVLCKISKDSVVGNSVTDSSFVVLSAKNITKDESIGISVQGQPEHLLKLTEFEIAEFLKQDRWLIVALLANGQQISILYRVETSPLSNHCFVISENTSF